MNFKKILSACIFILILSIGAVNAADENTTQELTIENAVVLETADGSEDLSINEGDIEVIGPDELFYETYNTFDVKAKAGTGDAMVIAHINNDSGTYVDIYNSSQDSVTPFQIEIKQPGNYIIDFEALQNGNYIPLKTFNYTVSKFNIIVWEPSFTIEDDYKELMIFLPEGASGTLEMTANGKTYKRTVADYGDVSLELKKAILGKNILDFKFTADSKSKYKSQTLTRQIIVLPTILCSWRVKYLSDDGIIVSAPGGEGMLNITVDGHHYKCVEVKDYAKVPLCDLALGKHNFTAVFINSEYSNNIEGEFEVVPNVNVSSFVREGDDNYMTVALPDNVSGNLVLQLNKKDFYKSADAKGIITIPLTNLKHYNTIDVNYTDDTTAYDDFFLFTCTKNSPNWDMKLYLESLISLDKDAREFYFYLNAPDDYDGEISVLIDGKKVNSYYAFNFTGYDQFDGKNYGNVFYAYYAFDNSKLKLGEHVINVIADGSEYYKPVNRTATFTATNFMATFDKVWYGKEVWDVGFPSDATGNIKFYVDDKLISTQKAISTSFSMPKNTKFGIHTLKFVYSGDKKYPKETITKKINYTYHFYPRYRNWLFFNDQQLIEGNKNILPLAGPSDFKGTVSITINGEKISKKTNNGYVEFDLSKFKAGNYTVKVESIGSGKFTKQSYYLYDFEILPKMVNIKADSSGYYDGYYKVKITHVNGSAAKNVHVDLFLNGYSYEANTDGNGVAKFKITEKAGKSDAVITCKYSKVEKKVTIKHLVSLSPVEVKRSAKSLTLKATLKKGSTPIKNKQITFKFNGKVVGKVKTNSKGIAKTTIKSSVLKKLKVGKKITYHATYKKDTVKRTVKVKK